MGGVSSNPSGLPQGPRGVRLLERGQLSASHLLSSTDDPLHSPFVFGCYIADLWWKWWGWIQWWRNGNESSLALVGWAPSPDSGCTSPAFYFYFLKAVNVQLHLQVLGNDGSEEIEGFHNLIWGVIILNNNVIVNQIMVIWSTKVGMLE